MQMAMNEKNNIEILKQLDKALITSSKIEMFYEDTVSLLSMFQGVMTYFHRQDFTSFFNFIISEGSAHG